MNHVHIPVMLEESIDYCRRALITSGFPVDGTGAILVDGTAGEGGHSTALMRAFPGSVLLSVDRDEVMLQRATFRLKTELGEDAVSTLSPDRFAQGEDDATQEIQNSLRPGSVHMLHLPFGRLPELLKTPGIQPAFVLLDLGVSMFHFQGANRGFSYTDDSLDMRLSGDLQTTAADLINKSTEEELADLIYNYGEEKFSRRIARYIVKARPIDRADRLADVVAFAVKSVQSGKSSKKKGNPSRIHPATRVFQALRIAVNDELGELQRALEGIPDALRPGGALGIISFHSLEDRMIKNAFRNAGAKRSVLEKGHSAARFEILTPRPIPVSPGEAEKNPAARSSKLRVIQKLADKQ